MNQRMNIGMNYFNEDYFNLNFGGEVNAIRCSGADFKC